MSALSGNIDPRSGQIVPPDFVVAQDMRRYTPQDRDLWEYLFRRQSALLRGRAVEEFHTGLAALAIDDTAIPDFDRLNRVLERATGWRIVAVPGLVPDEVFFAHLAARRFPAGYWLRSPDETDYIEEPDVFHDVFGHVPLLMHRNYADYMQAYGLAGRRCVDASSLFRLARLYWYTVEFGLMMTGAGLRIFGAGIASSAGESVYALENAEPARLWFDCERVMRTRYEIDHFQAVYFVLSDWNDLPKLDPASLARALTSAAGRPDIAAGEILSADRRCDTIEMGRRESL